MEKEKFELEYLLNTSTAVLENMISTPSGLSEWFADDVNIKDDIYTFFWDGSEEAAKVISKRNPCKVKWQWLTDFDCGEDTFVELKIDVDPMTKAVILTITDFADPTEMEEAKALWEQQVSDLKRIIGN